MRRAQDAAFSKIRPYDDTINFWWLMEESKKRAQAPKQVQASGHIAWKPVIQASPAKT
jgi:hypothetical protein